MSVKIPNNVLKKKKAANLMATNGKKKKSLNHTIFTIRLNLAHGPLILIPDLAPWASWKTTVEQGGLTETHAQPRNPNPVHP